MMSSPIVDCVREIPLIVERDYPMECDNTGFPFDEDREEGNATFRSQLDDIAARHPEFAHHLGSFPFRSGSRTRTQIPEEFTQRFADRPFPDRFERFGFPFEEPLAEEENKPYYQRYPQYYPQDTQENQQQPSFSGEESQNVPDTEVNEEGEQEGSGRGRKLKNIQQSNTVDLGQRQEPVSDRNQRSMSAPPSNNRQRFVSSINIPVNQPAESSNMPQNMNQPSAPPQPQERVIPIHVEGRDEPVFPKKASATTSQPQSHQHPHPPTDKFFTQASPNFSQHFNRDPNFQSNWFPKTFQNKQPQAQAGFGQNQRGRSPQPQPKQETAQPSTNIPEHVETQQKPVSSKPDPIDQIKSIQKDVSALMEEVDKFGGKPKDKQYLYLDEMLTRNLIKLDNIDTQGQENIRSARKEAIKCIEKCISILESKANANVAGIDDNRTENKEMEVDKQETTEKNITKESSPTPENKEKVVENTNISNPADQTMDVDPEKTDESVKNPAEASESSGEKTKTFEPNETSETIIESKIEDNTQEAKDTKSASAEAETETAKKEKKP